MQGIKKGLIVAVLTAVFSIMPVVIIHASTCSPTSAELCVAADDIAIVYLNDVYVGTFNYVNWDQTGVYPTCIALPVTLLAESGNYVALDIKNTACCEIWGSWSIETQCTGGTHSCISSDDNPMVLYNVPTPSDTPPPNDGSGRPWYYRNYTEEAHPTWDTAVRDTGTIYGKLIFNPCTGVRLQPLSYEASGSGPIPGTHIYMRQPFALATATPLGPPNFTITKSLVGPTPVGGYGTNQPVTYVLNVCNTGEAEQGIVIMTDDFNDAFGYSGPGGGDCDGFGDGSPGINCSWASGVFTAKWARGFPGNTCMNVTGTVTDWWVDSSEWCTTRLNWANIDSPVSDAASNTVSVSMYCPGTSTFTRTITQTKTITETHTFTSTRTPTPTVTVTLTKTRIPTWTNSPTPYPTGQTVTFTHTFSKTATYTVTATPTFTPTFTVTMTWVNAITLSKSENGQTNPAQGGMNVMLGDTVQYCIAFTNNGANYANFEIWDTIPGPMEILWASQDSTGDATINTFASGACYDYEGTPAHACRVLSWHMINVPPASMSPLNAGQVCFTVFVARLQTADMFQKASEYFAGIWDGIEKIIYSYDTRQRSKQGPSNIRGPDKTD